MKTNFKSKEPIEILQNIEEICLTDKKFAYTLAKIIADKNDEIEQLQREKRTLFCENVELTHKVKALEKNTSDVIRELKSAIKEIRKPINKPLPWDWRFTSQNVENKFPQITLNIDSEFSKITADKIKAGSIKDINLAHETKISDFKRGV